MKLAAVLLALAAIGCAGAPVTTPLPSADNASGATYSCGHGPAFPPEALDAPPGAETASGPAAAALRSHLDSERGEGFLPASGWRLVAMTDDAALYLSQLDSTSWASVLIERDRDGWSAAAWGGCDPIRGFDEAGVGTWRLDPAAPIPDDETTELHVLVTERDCASGQTSEGRIEPPIVTERRDAVVIVFRVRPLATSGAVACPGNPAVPVTVDLPGPVGGRVLLDGAFQPPRPPAAP